MKKLINISVIAALAVLPLAANAATGDIVAGEPVAASAANPAQAANAVTTTATPKYALAVESTKDGNLATVSYVKGAYNASMKAINKVSETIVDAATQAGVVATVKNATASKTGVSLDVSGTPTGTIVSGLSNTSISANVDVPTTGTVPVLTTWGDDNSENNVNVALSTTSTAVTGTVSGDVTSTFTGTGITNGKATGNISDIDVNVESYSSGI